MKNIKLGKLWDSLHSSYWFVPTLMAVIAIALAFTMLTLDRAGKSGPIESLGWIYAGGPDGARTLCNACGLRKFSTRIFFQHIQIPACIHDCVYAMYVCKALQRRC